jgi:formylglycine-generating enzyme required for sulfatase activity
MFRFYVYSLGFYLIIGVLVHFGRNILLNDLKGEKLGNETRGDLFRLPAKFINTNGIQSMAAIPSGLFSMGGELEHPIHTVRVSSFFIDRCEITSSRWGIVAKWSKTNGYDLPDAGCFGGPDHPAVMVNWFDTIKWCNARSEMEQLRPCYYVDQDCLTVYRSGVIAPFVKWKHGFRLPTESEWERAAKGGYDQASFPWPTNQSISITIANYRESGLFGTVPVASYTPNPFGLFDLAGNVREWCWDIWGPYKSDFESNPHGSPLGRYRVVRGGSWLSNKDHCRVSFRYYYYSRLPLSRDYQTGFRTVVQMSE